MYISDKNKTEWYSQKWQKRYELYNMTEVFTKEIAIFNWINVEEIDTCGTQKENFPEYNKEIYIFKNYEFNEADEKKILISKCVYCKNRKLSNDKAKTFITVMTKDAQDNKKFKNEIIEQKKVWKKAVKQIKIIMKKVFNIIWKSQKLKSSTELYNSEWVLIKNDTWDIILWKEKLWTMTLWKVIQEIHQKKKKMLWIDI